MASAADLLVAAESDAELELGPGFDWSLKREDLCGCWFLPIPAVAIRHSFLSLNVSTLFEKGVRLTGQWRVPDAVLGEFVARFYRDEGRQEHQDPQLLVHLQRAFGRERIDDTTSQALPFVRAAISDVAVFKLSGLPNPIFL